MSEIKYLPSLFFDERAPGSSVDTLIVHSMYNPAGSEQFSPEQCKLLLDSYQVSAHYLIDRTGTIWRCVAEEKRAWHAGKSKMPFADDTREQVNHFSVGIELFASETSGYENAQYEALTNLILEITKRHPVRNILGHSQIAPERKTDPWLFDWKRLKETLATKLPKHVFRYE